VTYCFICSSWNIVDISLPHFRKESPNADQTGLGKEIKGEGLVGMTRGFMYAGAARVMVSLWNVNDKATAELMAKFYQNMFKEGQRPAAALRSAQVEMLRSSQWQSPYFWAAFVLQGEWKRGKDSLVTAPLNKSEIAFTLRASGIRIATHSSA
jgi:CHAT domain